MKRERTRKENMEDAHFLNDIPKVNSSMDDKTYFARQKELERQLESGLSKDFETQPAVFGCISIALGLLGFVSAAASILGLVFGITGLVKKNRKILCANGILVSLLTLFYSFTVTPFVPMVNRQDNVSYHHASTVSLPADSGLDMSNEDTEQNSSDSGLANQNFSDQTSPATEKAVNDTDSNEDFSVKEYLYKGGTDSLYDFLVIRNNSETTTDITGEAKAYTTNGHVSDTADCSLSTLGPGEESITYFVFENSEDIDHVDYHLDYSPSSDSSLPVISDISLDETVNENNVILHVTNLGEKPADYLRVFALFMDKNDQVVDYTFDSLMNSQDSLPPGASVYMQLNAYTSFDHVNCYITGSSLWRHREDQETLASSVSQDQFDVEEYLCKNSYAVLDYLVIQNHSDETVIIDGNAVALNSQNRPVGASDCDSNVLGPGEQSIVRFRFYDSTEEIDHVDYDLSYTATENRTSNLRNLSAEIDQVSRQDQKITVKVTNHGSDAVSFIEVYALFFDADGNLVDGQSKTIRRQGTFSLFSSSDEYELPAGKTVSVDLQSYQAFDHVQLYLKQ